MKRMALGWLKLGIPTLLMGIVLCSLPDKSHVDVTFGVAAQQQQPAAKPPDDPNLKRWRDEENREYLQLLNEEAVYQAKLEAVTARRQAWILLMRDKYGCNTADWDAISDDKGGAFRKKAPKPNGKGQQ